MNKGRTDVVNSEEQAPKLKELHKRNVTKHGNAELYNYECTGENSGNCGNCSNCFSGCGR